MTGPLAIVLLLCFEQLSTFFLSFTHPFSLSRHVVLHTFAFPNTSNILSSCSHCLFHMFSLSFSQTLTVFWHSYFPPIQSLFLTLFYCTPTLLALYCFPHYFSSSFCVFSINLFLQSSVSSSFSFISYLPNLSPFDN